MLTTSSVNELETDCKKGSEHLQRHVSSTGPTTTTSSLTGAISPHHLGDWPGIDATAMRHKQQSSTRNVP